MSSNPADSTPHVLDGEVFAVAVVGDTVVVGGAFSKARNAAAGSPVVTRSHLLAFDRRTGKLLDGFHPALDGEVRSLAAGPDGTVYVGGRFATVDGASRGKLVRLDAATGMLVDGFDPHPIDAAVFDIELSGSRLFVGGLFTIIDGASRAHLAELDPLTGAVRPALTIALSGTAWGGATYANKIEADPAGTRLVVTGNFRRADAATRVQIAMIDISQRTASLSDWSTSAYAHRCGRSRQLLFDLRDVDFSPDGSYFVTAATGALNRKKASLCDAAARWESDRTGPRQRPTWVAWTGNDSVYSVSVTGSTVYIGGHFRWLNNPHGVDAAGPGAVARPGIAALDPANGMPLSWNPTRDRGRAVWDLQASSDGLYVGSDTERIGGEYHARIAGFPLVGGEPVPQPDVARLPADVDLLSPRSAPDSVVRLPDFDGSETGDAYDLGGSGWSNVRAALLAGDRLYVARTDGTLVRYRATGDSYIDPQAVDLHGLEDFADELSRMTSMVLEGGYLSYTVEGSNALYRRAFSTQSSIVGAERSRVPAKRLGLKNVRGGFLTTAGWYVVNGRSGTLARITWVDGAPVSGSRTVVSGPAVDGKDWRAAGVAATSAGS